MAVHELKHIARSLGDCRAETNQVAVARSPVRNRFHTTNTESYRYFVFSSHCSSARASLCQPAGAERLDCRRMDFVETYV